MRFQLICSFCVSVIKNLPISVFSDVHNAISDDFSQVFIFIIIGFLILDRIGVANFLSFSSTSSLFAFFGFGILAGVWVDRWNKKSVLIVTNLLRALIVFPLAFFYRSLGLVYLATFGVAMATQFFIPAETPIIPLLVKRISGAYPVRGLFSPCS